MLRIIFLICLLLGHRGWNFLLHSANLGSNLTQFGSSLWVARFAVDTRLLVEARQACRASWFVAQLGQESSCQRRCLFIGSWWKHTHCFAFYSSVSFFSRDLLSPLIQNCIGSAVGGIGNGNAIFDSATAPPKGSWPGLERKPLLKVYRKFLWPARLRGREFLGIFFAQTTHPSFGESLGVDSKTAGQAKRVSMG